MNDEQRRRDARRTEQLTWAKSLGPPHDERGPAILLTTDDRVLGLLAGDGSFYAVLDGALVRITSWAVDWPAATIRYALP